MLIVRSLNLFFVSVGFLLASLLFIKRQERRKFWYLRYIASAAVMFAVCILLSYIKNVIMSSLNGEANDLGFFICTYAISVIMYSVVFVLGITSIYLIYKTDYSEALFIGSASYALQSVSMGLFSVIMKLSKYNYQFNIQDIAVQPLSAVILVVCFVAVFVIAYFGYVRKYESERDFSSKICVYLIIVTLVNIVMGSANVPPSDNSVADRLYMVLLFSRIMLCLGGLLMQFQLSKYYRLRLSQLTLQHIMEQQKAQFEIEKENINTVNINAHDLRKQIALIVQATDKSGKNIESKISEIENKLDIVDFSYHTGNNALDVTLTEKARECKSKSIKFSAMADGGCLDYMEDLDVYVLFGNLLDNAIEAAEQVADEEERIISLKTGRRFDCITVHIENTFATEPNFVGGEPVTTKADKRFHGFGVKSIKNIVRKYGGKSVMKIKHGMFCVDIIIPTQNVAIMK